MSHSLQVLSLCRDCRDVIDPRFLIISELLSLQCNSWKLETYIWTEIGNLTGHLTKVLKLISYIHLILPTANSSIFLWVQYWVDTQVDSYCDFLCVFSEVFLSHNFTYGVVQEREFGPDHCDVATTLSNLGNAYDRLGNIQKQKELLERALAINEREYGRNLRVLLRLKSWYKRCIPCIHTSIFQYHGMGTWGWGPDHHVVATTLVNLGSVYGRCHRKKKKTGEDLLTCCRLQQKLLRWFPHWTYWELYWVRWLSRCIFTFIGFIGITVWSQYCLIGLGSMRRNATSWNEHWASWKQNLEPTVTRMGVSVGMMWECVSFGYWYSMI